MPTPVLYLDNLAKAQNEQKLLQVAVEEKNLLIRNLEQDILSIAVTPQHVGNIAYADTPQDPATGAVSIALGNTPDYTSGQQRQSLHGSPSSDAYQQNFNLVNILSSQRERFRQRVTQLEEEVVQYQYQLGMFQSEIDKIRGDNVKLYEKIKFLQSCGTTKLNVTSSSEDAEARYSRQYEEGLNPFTKFSQQERSRAHASLRPHDKASLGISRLLIASPNARLCFFFYLLFLHCLVFLVLYRLAYSESCRRDAAADCYLKFSQHMQAVHGELGGHKHS